MLEIRCDACKQVPDGAVYRITDDRLTWREVEGFDRLEVFEYCKSKFDLCQECRNRVLERLIELGVKDEFWHYPDFGTTNKKGKIAN